MPTTAAQPTLLDNLTPEAVHLAFPESAREAGRSSVERGRVSRPSVRPARADAVVVGADRRSHRTRLALADGGLASTCSCGTPWCAHAAALALLLTGEASRDGAVVQGAAASSSEVERQRREARGASELFEIRRRSGERRGLLGDYQVASPSARAYSVTLRALDAPHNGCSCPDFADGRLVGLVRGSPSPDAVEGAVLLDARVAEALGPLGSASPLTGAELLYRAPPDQAGPDPLLAARRDLLTLAERKRGAATALLAVGQPCEALALLRESMALACRALDERGDPGAEPAALLAAIHGRLLPERVLTEAEASALARAGEAARAFGGSTVVPPEALVAAVTSDAAALLAKARAWIQPGR